MATDLRAYSLITFASVTDCLKIKHFIHERLICTENKKATYREFRLNEILISGVSNVHLNANIAELAVN